MTIFNVSNAQQLTSALTQAHGGDTVLLASGNYGDFSASSLKYASAVTIESASQARPATFNSFHVTGSQNITVTDVNVHMAPTSTSVLWAAAVGIYNSTGITFSASSISGGAAVNGVPPDATALDATENVIGLPTGQGFTVVGSTGVSLVGNSLSQLDRGISLSNSSSINVSGNDITNLRQSGISAGGVSNVTISDNTMSDSNPWAWGKSYGDHADFIHIWTTPPAQTAPSSNINVTGNVISQGAGTPILGINFEAQAAPGAKIPVGFTGITISNNAVILGNAQGMRLENLTDSNVSHNTLIEPATGGVAAPGILLAQDGASNTVVTGNIYGSIAVQADGGGNTIVNNYLAQDQSQGAANYFAPAVAAQAAALTDPTAVRALVQQALPQTTTASIYQNTGANIVANLSSLANSSTISAIVVTDNTPLVLTSAQLTTNAQVLAEVRNQDGSHFGLVIKDAAVAIATNLDALNGQTYLKSIIISDNQPLWLSAAQVAQDKAALGKLVNGNGTPVPLNVTDTAANIGAVLDTLVNLNDAIANVSVKDKGVISLRADQFVNDQNLLPKIHSAAGYSIRDAGAAITDRLDELSVLQKQAGAHFASITVTDGAPIKVSYAELVSYANVIKMLANVDGSHVQVTVVDTAANILANLNSLNWTANIGSIVVSDGATLSLTSLLRTADAGAVSKLVYSDGSAAHLLTGAASAVLTPTVQALATAPIATGYAGGAVDVASKLDTLNGSGQPIIIADNQALHLSVSQALNDSDALSRIMNGNGTYAVVDVSDTAKNIAAHLSALGEVQGLRAITVADGKSLGMSVSQLNAEIAGVKHLATGSVSVTDTAAHVVSELASLGTNAAVGSISISDDNMVRVTATDFAADGPGLAKISGRHIVDEIGVKGQAYTSEFFTYNDAGTLVSDTYVAADGSRSIEAQSGHVVFASQPVAQTIHAMGGGNVFDFVQNFGSETIYGFQLGTDSIGMDRRIASSSAQVLASGADDGYGNVVFHVTGTETFTIADVEMSQLAAQRNLFHFF